MASDLSDKRLAAQSGAWSVVLQWSRLGINTIVFLILARWLSLAEIGAFAVAYAPINLLQMVQRAGFSETIVQGPKEPGRFTDTAFWMSLGTGLFLAVCIYSLSFVIAPIMDSEASGTYLAAMAVIPALIGAAAVPEGLLRQRLEIRTLAIRTATSLTIAGGLAIWMGVSGYGGWALTMFAIVNTLLSSVLVILLGRWMPQGGPRLSDARAVFPALAAISGRSFANQATLPVLLMFVGAGLGPAAAGAFQIAQRFLMLAATATLTPLRFASLPVFVRVRDDQDRLRRTIVKTAGLVSLFTAPMYFGLLATAPLLVPLAVGETNGTASVPVLQALLLMGGYVGLFPVCIQALTAIGRADVALRWALAVFCLSLAIGAVTVQYSVTLTALGRGALGYLMIPFMLMILHKYTGVRSLEVIWAVLRPVLAAIIMAIVVLLIDRSLSGSMNDLALLALEILCGALVYAVLCLLISRQEVATTRNLVATLLPKRL